MKHLICDYYEDALIYIEENKKFSRPYLIVEMDCDNLSDILFYEDFEWLYGTLNKEWAAEIINWTKVHLNEIKNIEKTHEYSIISERW